MTASAQATTTRGGLRAALLIGIAVIGLGVLDAGHGSALAQASGDAVFTDLVNKGTDFFYNGRTVALIICCIAIIATMLGAVTGRFPMQKAVVLAFAIIIIAFASSIVTYFASPGTQSTAMGISSSKLSDTAATAATP